MQLDMLLSHSPAVNILGAVSHVKCGDENSEALSLFRGEKRENGVIKTEVEWKEETKTGSLKMEINEDETKMLYIVFDFKICNIP